MFDAFAIALREFSEMALIVGALCVYLRNADQARLLASVKYGAVAGALPALGSATFLMDSSFDPRLEAVLETATALGVLAMATGMVASARDIRGRMAERLHTWLEDGKKVAPFAVFAFVAVVVCRELLEMAVFVQSIASKDGLEDALIGLALGASGAMLVLPLWRLVRWRAGLLIAFKASALLLSLLAVRLLLHGTSDLIRLFTPTEGSIVRLATEAFLEGGQHHVWPSAVLTGAVLLHAVRSWWFQTRADAAS